LKASRRALASSPAPTLARLAPSPAIEEELRWFFDIEDGDPSCPSNYGRMLSPWTEDGEWRTLEEHAAAERKHRVILSHLKSLSDRDAGVLQCAYAPRPWPARLAKELGRLIGVIVRLSCDRATWPEERGQQLTVDAENAEKLYAMLREGGDENLRVLRGLRREAVARFARALGEYVQARRARSISRAQ
jgi:hypothetical protein